MTLPKSAVESALSALSLQYSLKRNMRNENKKLKKLEVAYYHRPGKRTNILQRR